MNHYAKIFLHEAIRDAIKKMESRVETTSNLLNAEYKRVDAHSTNQVFKSNLPENTRKYFEGDLQELLDGIKELKEMIK